MINSFKTELWKATHNGLFYLAILLAFLICVADVSQNASSVVTLTQLTDEMIADGYLLSTDPAGYSLFVKWIPVNGWSFGSQLFALIWPILSAMPFGWSLAQERRIGAYNLIVTKTKLRTYYSSKYIATFISGGLVIYFLVMGDLFLNSLFCPDVLPRVEVLASGIHNGCFLSALYYTHPWWFALIWGCVSFLWGGTVACLCLTAGSLIKHKTMIILFPIFLLWTFNIISMFIMHIVDFPQEISPLYLILADPGRLNPGWIIFSEISVLLLLSYCIGYWQVKKHELV